MSSLDLIEANSSDTPGVKPTDRDDLADKVDEPLTQNLMMTHISMPSFHPYSQTARVRRDARSVNDLCQIVGSHDETYGKPMLRANVFHTHP